MWLARFSLENRRSLFSSHGGGLKPRGAASRDAWVNSTCPEL